MKTETLKKKNFQISEEQMKNNTRFIIDTMQWSYSRLTAYNQCPYSFYLKYVECNKGDENFYAQYGSFVHKILEKYAKDELSLFDLSSYYEEHYYEEVTCPAPPNKFSDIGQSYYEKGLDFLENIDLDLENYKILGVEKEVSFNVDRYNLIGFIDLLLKDRNGNIIILDHKSGSLKTTKNGTISKTSEEHFESYKRQLYLYSIPVIEEYGQPPQKLKWNLFKDRKYIEVEFNENEFEQAKQWVTDTIHSIEKDINFYPNPSAYFCNNICDMRNCACEYKP